MYKDEKIEVKEKITFKKLIISILVKIIITLHCVG